MAKFLDVNSGDRQPSVTQQDVENKMLEGTRADQQRRRDLPERTTPLRPTPMAAIRLAAELGVDLAHVEPTGEDGLRITEEDVRKAAEDPAKLLPAQAVINDSRARPKSGTARTASGVSTDAQREEARNREQNRSPGERGNKPLSTTPENADTAKVSSIPSPQNPTKPSHG